MAEMLRSNNELARHAQITEQDNLLMKVSELWTQCIVNVLNF